MNPVYDFAGQGGGLFMDYFKDFWTGFRPIAERVPFAIWGVGCCDLKRQHSRLPAESILADRVWRLGLPVQWRVCYFGGAFEHVRGNV